MIFLNLLIINFLLVGAIDYLGFVEEITPLLKRITGSRIGRIGKPFNCSTCSTFWIGLAYLLFAGAFTLPNIALCLGVAMLSPVTLDLINFTKDLLTEIITFFYKIFSI